MVGKTLETIYSTFSFGVVFLMCNFGNCICLASIIVILCLFVVNVCLFFVLCVFVISCVFFCTSYVYLLYYVCIAVLTLDAVLLARSQYPEGPATGHLDTGFSWFPCVYKQMLRWFPRLQVATACSHVALPT
jgi:hypothetical protein